MAAYKFVRRLKALGCLTAYECTCEIWAPEPNRFILDPLHQMPRLITYAACWIVGASIDPAPATKINIISNTYAPPSGAAFAFAPTLEALWKQEGAKLLETKRNPHPFDNTNPSAQPAPKPRKKRSFVSAHDQHAGRLADIPPEPSAQVGGFRHSDPVEGGRDPVCVPHG
jgi:hypothetical protein